MFKLFLLSLFVTTPIVADFKSDISPITPKIKKRMQGKSWTKGCPVSISELRYVKLTYKDFKYADRQGELIVHKSVSSDVVEIFKALYQKSYPIRKMKLVSSYKGSDWKSIEADNTSAYNCRNVGGTNRWSKHSYGKAIDINPIENPYVFSSGKISHKASYKYRSRAKQKNLKPDNQAIILKNSDIVKIFKKYGWKWGGNFRGEKDYQHFAK